MSTQLVLYSSSRPLLSIDAAPFLSSSPTTPVPPARSPARCSPMTDLLRILPGFPTVNFSSLLPTLEHHGLTTADLLAQHPADIARQTRLPLLDLKRLVDVVHASLVNDAPPTAAFFAASETSSRDSEQWPPSPRLAAISSLDEGIDSALGGGVPVGRLTEFAGESGAGKTQFLLTLCLSVQLPPPRGLARKALYVSTEAAMSTQRLSQILASNPALRHLGPDRPSLDNILSTVTPDLESQDHILEFQVPVLLSRHSVGLLVIDSVAANYRAEFERQGPRGSNMAARSAQLVRLGALLRDLARRHNLAVVVANQVADRFSSQPASAPIPRPSSSLPDPALEEQFEPSSDMAPPPPSTSSLPFLASEDSPPAHPALVLDRQQRWFTGWGDDPHVTHSLKTPSLGLVWSTQIACRIALLKRPYYGRPRKAAPLRAGDDVEAQGSTLKVWRRWIKVVFAPHVGPSGPGIATATEFEITMGGLRSSADRARTSLKNRQHAGRCD